MDWINGKPGGALFQRKSGNQNKCAYYVVFNNTNPKMTKYFSFNTYGSEDEALIAAENFRRQKSLELGLTRNMYRRLPDDIYWNDDPSNFPKTKNTYEVHIKSKNEDIYTLVDESDLEEIEKNTLCVTKSGRTTAKQYVNISSKGTREDKKNGNVLFKGLHTHLLNVNMVDHINRNPMDNRRCNLRETTPKKNNNNKGNVHKGNSGILGVRFCQKDESWQARIKQDDKEYSKSFSVKKYGYEEAKQMAIIARMEFNKNFNCENG